MIKKNVGNTDMVIRVIAALVITVLYFTNMVSGIPAMVLFAVAIVLLATGVFSFCPLYTLFGVSTCKSK